MYISKYSFYKVILVITIFSGLCMQKDLLLLLVLLNYTRNIFPTITWCTLFIMLATTCCLPFILLFHIRFIELNHGHVIFLNKSIFIIISFHLSLCFVKWLNRKWMPLWKYLLLTEWMIFSTWIAYFCAMTVICVLPISNILNINCSWNGITF